MKQIFETILAPLAETSAAVKAAVGKIQAVKDRSSELQAKRATALQSKESEADIARIIAEVDSAFPVLQSRLKAAEADHAAAKQRHAEAETVALKFVQGVGEDLRRGMIERFRNDFTQLTVKWGISATSVKHKDVLGAVTEYDALNILLNGCPLMRKVLTVTKDLREAKGAGCARAFAASLEELAAECGCELE